MKKNYFIILTGFYECQGQANIDEKLSIKQAFNLDMKTITEYVHGK
jgi:hypothetical protein